jgi:ferredoxin-type protein NapH
MKRLKVRKALVIISFLLFPLTIYYLSPYLIIMGAGEGIITGSFIVFIAMFLFSLFFGRLLCGWVCPVGGLQDCLMLANDKKAKGGRKDWIKYFIWAPWIILIGFAAAASGGLKKLDFLYMTFHGISISEPGAYIIYYVVLILVTVLSLIAGRRSFCHYVCWMAPFMVIGRKVSILLRLPSLGLKAEQDNCTHCRICSNKCPMSLEVDRMVEKGTMENPECILCGECTANCPKKVIHYTFQRKK